jgi:hypothetical protein
MEKVIYELIRPADLAGLKPEKDAHYVFGDDFLLPLENVTENEKRSAEKYLTLLGINFDNSSEIIFSIYPNELYNLFVSVQLER